MRLLSTLLPLVLAGCASLPAGVTMTDEERAACAAAGCTVWTDAEIQGLAMEAMRQGFIRGAQSSGRAL